MLLLVENVANGKLALYYFKQAAEPTYLCFYFYFNIRVIYDMNTKMCDIEALIELK